MGFHWSFLWSPRLYSVFWPIATILVIGWFQFFLRSPTLPFLFQFFETVYLCEFFTFFWMVSIPPLISNFYSLFSPKPLGAVPSVPTTIGTTITLMFHSFFCSLRRSKPLFIFLISFSFKSVVHRNSKIHQMKSSFRLVNQYYVGSFKLGDPFVSQSLKEFHVQHFSGQILVCAFTSLTIFRSYASPAGSPAKHTKSYISFELVDMLVV